MTTLYCAECEKRFEPDDDHVRVPTERRRMQDRNEREDYVFHIECWDQLSEEWVDPV